MTSWTPPTAGRRLKIPRGARTVAVVGASANPARPANFVLTYLLGYDRVRNYDGSWTEWGNAVRAPIER